MIKLNGARIIGGVLTAVALTVASAVPAVAGPAEPSDTCKRSSKIECADTADEGGIRARVDVLDTICIDADALTQDQLANARVLIPCGKHRHHEYCNNRCKHQDKQPVVIVPIEDDDDDAVEVVSRPRTIVADLPVTH